MELQPRQFHEMTKEEFEAQPGTFFHGTPTGVVGSGGSSFHVGTRRAALEAVSARAGTPLGPHPTHMTETSSYAYSGQEYGWQRHTDDALENHLKNRRHSGKPVSWGDASKIMVPDPQVHAGRIAAPMVNRPWSMGRYGRGSVGDMHDSGDVSANARELAIRTRGQTMRQGIYYKNAAEDAGSVSAIIPNRAGFKTHEDYLVEARRTGKKIPKRVAKGYTQIPGQQRMVF